MEILSVKGYRSKKEETKDEPTIHLGEETTTSLEDGIESKES